MDKETLALKAQVGDREALAQLWEAVRPLLHAMARRFYTQYGPDACARHGVTLEDLQQEIYFALLDAVKAFKPEKGFLFTSYLSYSSKNRFRACMGLLGTHRNALDYSDSMNRPVSEEDDTESGDLIPDPQATAELAAVDLRDERRYYIDIRSWLNLLMLLLGILILRKSVKETICMMGISIVFALIFETAVPFLFW